jgi:hypothetical protein
VTSSRTVVLAPQATVAGAASRSVLPPRRPPGESSGSDVVPTRRGELPPRRDSSEVRRPPQASSPSVLPSSVTDTVANLNQHTVKGGSRAAPPVRGAPRPAFDLNIDPEPPSHRNRPALTPEELERYAAGRRKGNPLVLWSVIAGGAVLAVALAIILVMMLRS